MNTFIIDMLAKEIQGLMDAKCPSDLVCGDDDAWYNQRRIRIDELLLFVEVANGRVDNYDSGDLIAINKEIMALVVEKIDHIRYNSKEYLESAVRDMQDQEYFLQSIKNQDDPKGA